MDMFIHAPTFNYNKMMHIFELANVAKPTP
jgi:hypothetical protein